MVMLSPSSASTRAPLAAALGRVADKDWLPWHALFTSHSNYRAKIPTRDALLAQQ